MISRVVRKVYSIIRRNNHLQNVNIKVGPASYLNPSSIISTSGNGLITLKGRNYIGRNVELSTSGIMTFGDNTSIQDRCILLGDITIGTHCVFAPNVYISSGRHNYNLKPEYYIKDQDEMVLNDANLRHSISKKVTIEDDCWLGINTVVMSGVTIHKGAVVGANSVVTKDVQPYTVVAGTPAKMISKRLEFVPPKQLSYSTDADIPYFYNGFFVDKANVELGRKAGGIGVGAYFTVCADGKAGVCLVIKLKSNIEAELLLTYHDQERTIAPGEFLETKFDANGGDYHFFDIKVDKQISGSQEILAYIQSIAIV